MLKSFGFFSESGNFFIIAPYAKLIKFNYFSSFFKSVIYFFPKYRFINNLTIHSLIVKQYTVFFSLFSYEYSVIFKYLITFNHKKIKKKKLYIV